MSIESTPSRAAEPKAMVPELRMEFGTWEQFVTTCERDLRRGTLFYPSLRPPAPGTAATLILHLADGLVLGVKTRVARVISPDLALALGNAPGAWLRLAPISDQERDAVTLLARKARVSIPDAEPSPFAVGTNPGMEAAPTEVGAVGSAPTEPSLISLRVHLAALALRDARGVLDIPDQPSPEQVQASYRALRDRWHPARFEVAAEEVRETVAEIAIHIEHAYRELSGVDSAPHALRHSLPGSLARRGRR